MSEKIEANLLFREFQKVETAIAEWQSGEGPNRIYNGHQVKAISAKLDNALRYFCNYAADQGKEVDPKAYIPICRIDSFAKAYEKFIRDAVVEVASPSGTDAVWTAWDHVRQAFIMTRSGKPRAIKHLIEVDKAPEWQIAAIYGFVNEAGEPDVIKVSEEYEKPGTHYNPDTWISPADVKKQKLADEEWAGRKSTREANFDLDPEFDPDPKPLGKTPVRSLSELVKLNAPAAQIARLHGISVEEAEDLLREAGQGEKRELVPAHPDVAFQEQMDTEEAKTAKASPKKK